MKKRYIGNWRMAYKGKTQIDIRYIDWKKDLYWELKDKGLAIQHEPKGSNRNWYWQISETDSVFKLIEINTDTPDTLSYKIYKFDDNIFSSFKYPNESLEKELYVVWQKYEAKN